MISIENLTYKIKGKTLVDQVSARFESGKMHLILGPNGAGKSTLIKLISGELKPNSGNIAFDGKNLQDIALLERAKHRAVLSQNLELSFPLTAREVVEMGRYPHFDGKPNHEDIQICEEAMNLFSIQELSQRNYLTLSGGEKQRVQFARVFAQVWNQEDGKPRLLLLDEPLTFLDIFYQYDLMNKVKEFMKSNPDLTVIGVVHNLAIAAKYADQIMLLKNSKIHDFGIPEKVMNPNNIYQVFQVKVRNGFEVY